MDITKKYIDMCRKASELREFRPPETHQRAYFYCGIHDRLLEYNSELECQWCGDWGDWHGADVDRVIWLPTLTELYNIHTPPDSEAYSAYGIHRKRVHDQVFDSVEQHLLAFVMFDRFSKRWDGSNWVQP